MAMKQQEARLVRALLFLAFHLYLPLYLQTVYARRACFRLIELEACTDETRRYQTTPSPMIPLKH